jgi:hypothetical protein
MDEPRQKIEDFLRELSELSHKYQLGIYLESHMDVEFPTIELFVMGFDNADHRYTHSLGEGLRFRKQAP